MDPGIYTLILRLDRRREIRVGSLGSISFREGHYAYSGSARGTGGLKRVKRHLDVLGGLNKSRHWHIDFILPLAVFEGMVVTYTAQDLECIIARRIGAMLEPIPGFGCTDCRCISHLHFSADLEIMLAAVRGAHSDPVYNIDNSGNNHNSINRHNNININNVRKLCATHVSSE
jgi:Uri superfamily endonuclease